MCKNIAMSKAQLGADPTIGGRNQSASPNADDTPKPDLVVLPGMPPESRIAFPTSSASRSGAPRSRPASAPAKNAAAKAFTPIAQRCG